MPHNKHSFDRGSIVVGTVPSQSGLRLLDQQASESINGDVGSVHVPSFPIIIGTVSGNPIAVSVDTYGEFTGGVSTGLASNGLILGNNDHPILVTPRSRTFVIPPRDLFTRIENAYTAGVYNESVPGSTQLFKGDGTAQRIVVAIPSYRLVNGATLSGVTLNFRIGLKPTSLPTDFLGFRLVRIPNGYGTYSAGTYTSAATNELWGYPPWTAATLFPTGTAIRAVGGFNGWVFRRVYGNSPFLTGGAQPAQFTVGTSLGLNITDNNVVWQAENCIGAGFTGSGFVAMPRGNMVWAPSAGFGTSMDQYYSGGNNQTLTMVPNQNNVIDTTTWQYAIEIVDKCAVPENNVLGSIAITMTGISDMRPVA